MLSTDDLVTLPAYTGPTTTILSHPSLFLDATQDPQSFLTILAIVKSISRVCGVLAVESVPSILDGTPQSHTLASLHPAAGAHLCPWLPGPHLGSRSPHESMALLLRVNLISTSLAQKL